LRSGSPRPDKAVQGLLDALGEFTRDAPQADDVTMVVLKAEER